jgi:hypothetical protein
MLSEIYLIPSVASTRGRLLLVHHVARMCGISRRTVRWHAQRGDLQAFKDPSTPKLWRFLRHDVEDFKARRDHQWN